MPHCGIVVQILWLIMAFYFSVNWVLSCSETSVVEGWHCAELC